MQGSMRDFILCLRSHDEHIIVVELKGGHWSYRVATGHMYWLNMSSVSPKAWDYLMIEDRAAVVRDGKTNIAEVSRSPSPA